MQSVEAQEMLERMYEAFNARDTDAALGRMTDDVCWPKASEGGTVVGKEAIRAYWSRQWNEFSPVVTPLGMTQEADGAVRVRVRQVVRNLQDEVLSDTEVVHVFTLRGDRVAAMALGDAQDGPTAAFAH